MRQPLKIASIFSLLNAHLFFSARLILLMEDHFLLSIAVLLLGLLGHGYFWVAIVNRLHGWHGPRSVINRATRLSMLAFVLLPCVVFSCLVISGVNFFLIQSAGIRQLTSYYVWLCFFVGLGNLLATILCGYREDDPSALQKKTRVLAKPLNQQPSKRYGPGIGQLFGRFPLNESGILAIDEKTLAVPNLPAALKGLRIAHLSDLHVTGRMSPSWYRFVVEQTNALQPDMIAITGDLVEKEELRSQLVEAMGELRARLGVYFILGNHDLYIDHEQTVSALIEAGLVYVGDKQLHLEWDGAEILMLGNELPWLAHQQAIRRGVPPEQFRFFLMHTPDQFDWAVANEGNLVLAGHTHGGQVRLPVLGAAACPSLYGTRFACGTFRSGRTVMHVSRGVCGANPLRWRCPPELAILELHGITDDTPTRTADPKAIDLSETKSLIPAVTNQT